MINYDTQSVLEWWLENRIHFSLECPREYSNEPVGVGYHVLGIELTEEAEEVEYTASHCGG